jgi:LacI family transcriptional regulator
VPRVFVENEAGAHEAMQHLIEAGHRKIGYIGGPVGLFSAEERKAGYRRALVEAEITVREDLIRVGSFSPDFAKDAVDEFIAMDDPPTAIFGSSDYLAIGAVRGLRNAGINVPDEMSLIGFDDVPMTDLLQPPLTSVRQPIEALGRQAFLALFALLNGKQPAMLTRLPVELIRRGSVGAPRKGNLKR